jgi:hypothetical protein
MNVTRWLLAATLLGTFSVDGGVRFDFVANAGTYSYSGRMWIEGTKSRLVITEGRHPLFKPDIMILTHNGGMKVIVVDHATHTYFQRTFIEARGPLATVAGIGTSSASRWRVSKSKEHLDDGGAATERHIVRVQYDLTMEVEGQKLDGTVQMEAEFDIDPTIVQKAHRWGLQYGAKTGYPKLDDIIAGRIPDRLPLRQVVSVSRQIAGGPVMTESLQITLSNVVEETLTDREFYAPAGYPYREPVFKFGE